MPFSHKAGNASPFRLDPVRMGAGFSWHKLELTQAMLRMKRVIKIAIINIRLIFLLLLLKRILKFNFSLNLTFNL